jgi:histidine kinase
VLWLPSGEQAHEQVASSDRTRLYERDGKKMLGIIRPIENEPGCANASCHAHPSSKRLLGVLDVSLTLGAAERAREQTVH